MLCASLLLVQSGPGCSRRLPCACYRCWRQHWHCRNRLSHACVACCLLPFQVVADGGRAGNNITTPPNSLAPFPLGLLLSRRSPALQFGARVEFGAALGNPTPCVSDPAPSSTQGHRAPQSRRKKEPIPPTATSLYYSCSLSLLPSLCISLSLRPYHLTCLDFSSYPSVSRWPFPPAQDRSRALCDPPSSRWAIITTPHLHLTLITL